MSSADKPLVWFITGCSSGFGLTLAMLALRSGHKVIATSRNPSKTPELLQQVESQGGIWLELDITAEKEVMQTVLAQVQSLMNTNFIGPFNLIQAALPGMRAQKSGIIVNISSAAGVDPRPAMGMYGASKFALEGMSQGLAKEVAPFGIRVLIVQPGAFATNMMNVVTMNSNPLSKGYEDTEVGKFMALFDGAQRAQNGKSFVAANDVEKGSQGIFEVVTGTGRGEGKEQHWRLPLSRDIAQRTKEQVERLQLGYETFRDIWENTGRD
ncbi:putative oxidoreductase [Lachnellula suecica]|uniref:Putative oxidoreductase n=1 Tax=Lachnellula suecica TaxID=602035 RepID=A0A8T9C0T8_9HELO|nr:putative oxidoreductase [Lachnellula suecica]